MSKITLQLFGAFRDFKSPNEIELVYKNGMTVADLKKDLKAAFSDQEPYTSLLARSRIADAMHIYAEDSVIEKAGEYAILPPVNGG